MSEILLMKQKIEEGKTARLKEWMAEIRDREDEAIATLEKRVCIQKQRLSNRRMTAII